MLHQPAWLQHLIVSYLCLSDSFKANHAVSEWCQGFLLRQATGPNVLLLQAMECMYTYPACLKRVILTARSPVSYIGHMQYESSASRKWSISSCHGLLLTDGVVEAPPYEQGITVYPGVALSCCSSPPPLWGPLPLPLPSHVTQHPSTDTFQLNYSRYLQHENRELLKEKKDHILAELVFQAQMYSPTLRRSIISHLVKDLQIWRLSSCHKLGMPWDMHCSQ